VASIPMHRLQRADKLLGALACVALQPLRLLRRRPRAVERVLVIKFWGIGSLQLLTPAVSCLRRRHPGARIELLTLAPNAAFAEGLDLFDRVTTLDVEQTGWPRLMARITRLVLELRGRRHDVVYDFEFFTRFSSVVSLLTGAPRSAGFVAPTVWRGGFHNERVPFNRYWHVARNFRCLAGGENGEPVRAGDLSPFQVRPEHEAELSRLLPNQDGRALIVLNPNAGTLSLERRWPRERFAALDACLVRGDDARIVLIGSDSEREWSAGVAALTTNLPEGGLIDATGRLSVGGLHALLARADAFVGNDSGPMHLAAALGTPTMGLFGPETPQMYAPLGARALWLYEPPPCSPCINVHDNKVSSCVLGRPECLINLEVGRVHAAVRELLRGGDLRLVSEDATVEEREARS
jgi:ADP-heptose:LPS heptosyltransferase